MQREKVEQAHATQLLKLLGAEVYVCGTRRRRGDYQGTMQTPGLPDVPFIFLPPRGPARDRVLLVYECKAPGGRLRPEQARFRALCQEAGLAYVCGDCNTLIAWLIAHGYLKTSSVPHYRQPALPASAERTHAS